MRTAALVSSRFFLANLRRKIPTFQGEGTLEKRIHFPKKIRRKKPQILDDSSMKLNWRR